MNIQAKSTLTMKKQKHNRRSNLLLFEQVVTVRHAIGDGNLVKSHKLRNYLKHDTMCLPREVQVSFLAARGNIKHSN